MARSDRIRTDLHTLIRNLDARCRASVAETTRTQPPDQWTAVLFLVHTQRFLTPLEQVSEVLELPRDITHVPGTKPWLIGVANNRGVLLPIFHLARFMESTHAHALPPALDPPTTEHQRQRRSRERVLVIRQDELPCGLIVSEAVGMRSIQFSARTNRVPDGFGACQPYIDASFTLDETLVPVIRLARLIADPLFQAAG